MVQTIKTLTLSPQEKILMIEKPLVLERIFFSIRAFADDNLWYQTKISFDDPFFHSFYVLNGPAKYFEAKGEDIFQGDIWVLNTSSEYIQYSSTEILH